MMNKCQIYGSYNQVGFREKQKWFHYYGYVIEMLKG